MRWAEPKLRNTTHPIPCRPRRHPASPSAISWNLLQSCTYPRKALFHFMGPPSEPKRAVRRFGCPGGTPLRPQTVGDTATISFPCYHTLNGLVVVIMELYSSKKVNLLIGYAPSCLYAFSPPIYSTPSSDFHYFGIY